MQARRTIVISGSYFIPFEEKQGEDIIPHQLNYTIHIKGNKTEFREIKVIIRQQIKFR